MKIFFVFIFLFSQVAFGAKAICVNPLKAYLDDDFTLKFEQKTFYSFLPKPKESEGTLIVSKNGKYFWEIKGQNSGTVVSNGKKAWIYTPAEDDDEASVMIKPADSFFNTANVFNKCYKDDELSSTKNKITLKDDSGNSYKWLSIEYIDKPFKITTIEFEDFSSVKTVIKTTSFEKKKVKSSVFEFKVPKGTRIIN